MVKLSTPIQFLLGILSFFIIAFGQPAWIPLNGLLAGCIGYALFWRILLEYPSARHRFWLSALWFSAVQLIQLSWLVSHPYFYIYAVYIFLACGLGLQFGVIGIFIDARKLKSYWNLGAIAGLWTLMEWSRLFFLTGFSWNPAGISLTGNLYALQMASLGGVFGLSFWVFFVNLAGLRAWIEPKFRAWNFSIWTAAALFPYLFGIVHFNFHALKQSQSTPIFSAVLVQTAFPAEEAAGMNFENLTHFVIDEWYQVLRILKDHEHQSIDLIVLPEGVVPFGTYSFVYPAQTVFHLFETVYGPESIKALPPLEFPYSVVQKTSQGHQILVNNAFWAQGIANLFNADILAGLEDADENLEDHRKYYSGALFFHPSGSEIIFPERYGKRVLLPMAEYIPFSFCENLAARYGVFASFTPGKEAKVMNCRQVLFSPSICYEETFGDLIRQGRQLGANLFINLTSDVWYPNSKLPRQHFDHSRLRTVENGVSLLRACNTGITGALDSLGQIIAVLGGEHPEEVEWVPDSLYVRIPVYSYWTLYSHFGDSLIIALSTLLILVVCFKKSNQ